MSGNPATDAIWKTMGNGIVESPMSRRGKPKRKREDNGFDPEAVVGKGRVGWQGND